jgi:hypothetical protein
MRSIALMEDRADCQIAFQIVERRFHFHQLQIKLPQLRRVGAGEVRAQQVAAFTSARGMQADDVLELINI